MKHITIPTGVKANGHPSILFVFSSENINRDYRSPPYNYSGQLRIIRRSFSSPPIIGDVTFVQSTWSFSDKCLMQSHATLKVA